MSRWVVLIAVLAGVGPPVPFPRPVLPSSVATFSPAGPVTLFVGDSIDLTVTMRTSPNWPTAFGTHLVVDVPGYPFAVDQWSQSAGGCVPRFDCEFGNLPGGSAPYMTMRLRAKAVGSYQVVARPYSGEAVALPVTVVPRRGDLGVTATRPAVGMTVGGSASRQIVVSNRGPDAVEDAFVTVGSPRGLTVTATIAGGTCTTVPIRCSVPTLAPGRQAVLRVAWRAMRRGRVGIPIGVASAAAQDENRIDNSLRLVVMTR